MLRVWLLAAVTLGLVVMAGTAIALVPFDWSEVRVQQATIAAIVVAVGWFAGFALRETGRLLTRAERLRDMHRALYAEIKHNLRILGDAGALRDYGNDMLERIVAADAHVPFIPSERNDTVFRTIVGELHILPRVSIDAVVSYYSHVAALEALSEDMRGHEFRAMTPRSRAELYADYIGIKLRLIDHGNGAMRIIDAYARKGLKAAKRENDWIEADRAARG